MELCRCNLLKCYSPLIMISFAATWVYTVRWWVGLQKVLIIVLGWSSVRTTVLRVSIVGTWYWSTVFGVLLTATGHHASVSAKRSAPSCTLFIITDCTHFNYHFPGDLGCPVAPSFSICSKPVRSVETFHILLNTVSPSMFSCFSFISFQCDAAVDPLIALHSPSQSTSLSPNPSSQHNMTVLR